MKWKPTLSQSFSTKTSQRELPFNYICVNINVLSDSTISNVWYVKARNKKKILDLENFGKGSEPWARHRWKHFPFSLCISFEIATHVLM